MGEKINKPQIYVRVEKSLIENIAKIESILESLKSDFNYIKTIPDCSEEINTAKVSLPSFVEVVRRVEKLEYIINNKLI